MRLKKDMTSFRSLLGQLVLVVIFAWVFVGCNGSEPTPTATVQPTEAPTPVAAVQPPEISEPKISTSTSLKPRKEIGIAVDVSAVTGITLNYDWQVDDGQIVKGQESPAITYRTPEKPGIYQISVRVSWDGQSVTKTAFITVEAEPTPTPDLEPPTDTPASPTDISPPPTCQSARPPLGGPPTNVEIEITSPRHCDRGLATSTIVSGTYSGDLAGKEIWIMIYPTNIEYYPQSLDPCKELPSNASGGRWTTKVNFGGPPQQYDVVAFVTDANGEASQEFKKWLQNGCKTGDFPGYLSSELPGGISEMDAITVSTSE